MPLYATYFPCPVGPLLAARPTTQHLEVTTRAAYGYYLDKHFLPRFGKIAMRRISPTMIQAWVNDVTRDGLSARSVVKYHALLHKIFARATIDRAIAVNPASHTALPKVISKPKQIITAEQFEQILLQLPARYRMMVLLAIETGLRWGELIALRPCDIDMTTHVVLVRRTIGEVAKKNSPTGERVLIKNYPKDDEQRSVQIDQATCQQLQEHIRDNDIEDGGLLVTSGAGTPLSRNNFRTKFWTPAVKDAKVQQTVTFHNLRAAHASWLLTRRRRHHRRPRTTRTPTHHHHTAIHPPRRRRPRSRGVPQDPLQRGGIGRVRRSRRATPVPETRPRTLLPRCQAGVATPGRTYFPCLPGNHEKFGGG